MYFQINYYNKEINLIINKTYNLKIIDLFEILKCILIYIFIEN